MCCLRLGWVQLCCFKVCCVGLCSVMLVWVGFVDVGFSKVKIGWVVSSEIRLGCFRIG